MNKKELSERDICTKFITPAVVRAGWDLHLQIREEVSFTAGQVLVRGKVVKRGEAKRADYILYYKPNLPLAIIEAKDNKAPVGGGMQQALLYGEALQIPFVYSSNGDGFLEHDRTARAAQPERFLSNEAFPSPDELWRRYCKARGIGAEAERVVTQDYHTDGSGKEPRYYQVNAINRVVEAVAAKQPRILLVMATGTGKTYTAFQIIWRLWKAGVKKRILFLADRNILVDQTRTNDFKPFAGAMTKITNRKVDKSFEIYLALYQAISGSDESRDIFKQFSRDFFDLVVVDECHRGSAAANSAWREILDYFSPATQIGLTATPKETEDVSTTNYFGEAVYTYSLKQGIEDGFLAPYKVVRYDFDKDLTGWRPTKGKKDKLGQEIADRVYEQRDFDRTLVIEPRTALVARKISDYLKATDRHAKTIVFCDDIDHAERMRQALVNENPDLCAFNRKYVMRITGDNNEGKAELDSFIHPEEPYPVLVTTSKLLSTGVDAQTCKVIALDQTIRSMSEFKQIVGRGTRLREDCGKMFFTILDFKSATRHFADPDFDAEPVQIYVPRPGDPAAPPDDPDAEGALPSGEAGEAAGLLPGEGGDAGPEAGLDAGEPIDPLRAVNAARSQRRTKYVVDVPVTLLQERVQYIGKDGKLIQESVRDFSRRAVRERYPDLGAFVKRWAEAAAKKGVVDELLVHGFFFEELAQEVGRDVSSFDLVCHVAYDRPVRTRRERAGHARGAGRIDAWTGPARAVLEALLDKFVAEGVEDLADMALLKVAPLPTFGTPLEILAHFGGKEGYLAAVRALQSALHEI